MANSVNLRVYRRSAEDIILLWNTKSLTESQKGLVRLAVAEAGDHWKPVNFLSAYRDETFKVDKHTGMAVIPYRENKLLADEDYNFMLTLGSCHEQIEARIEVFAFGVLPDRVKDESRSISQLYCYLPKKRRWAKMPLVDRDGVLALPVFVTNISELVEEIKKIKK